MSEISAYWNQNSETIKAQYAKLPVVMSNPKPKKTAAAAAAAVTPTTPPTAPATAAAPKAPRKKAVKKVYNNTITPTAEEIDLNPQLAQQLYYVSAPAFCTYQEEVAAQLANSDQTAAKAKKVINKPTTAVVDGGAGVQKPKRPTPLAKRLAALDLNAVVANALKVE